MKAHSTTSLYSLLITLCLSGCESCTCPPSVQLGTVSLKNTAFIPYYEGQLLPFTNALGRTIVLKDTLDKTESTNLFQESICAKAPFSSSYYYYEALNTRSLSLKPLTYIPGLYGYAIRIWYGVNNIQGPRTDTIFYDLFNASNSIVGGNLSIVTNDRGSRAKFPVNMIDNYQRYRIIADTTMNGLTYRDVYAPVSNPTLYYSSSLGIVAFKDKQEWWYLKQ